MRESNRLSVLKVRLSRHDRPYMLFRFTYQGELNFTDSLIDCLSLRLHIHSQVEGDLVVPAPRGVKLACHLADAFVEQLFDVHVDVFSSNIEGNLSGTDVVGDPLQARDDLLSVGRRYDAALSQHPRVRDAPLDIMLPKTSIEAYRSVELVHKIRRLLAKPTAPQLSHYLPFFNDRYMRD